MRLALLLWLGACSPSLGQAIDLPARPASAIKGSDFARSVASATLVDRERRVVAEVMAGNVPAFYRRLAPVSIERGGVRLTYFVAPDYLAVGSDEDYWLVPLSPQAAQTIADRLGCLLPTTKMVDDIYAAAKLKLAPRPIPPSPAMTTVAEFVRHQDLIRMQRRGIAPGALVAGHKKDLVITNRLLGSEGREAIYGWHRAIGRPIQPLYTGHSDRWVDYSHGVRLVLRKMTLDGRPTTAEEILSSKEHSGYLSDEGPMRRPRYGPEPSGRRAGPDEVVEEVRFDPGVRVVVNRPRSVGKRPVLLVFYALPNGNTIEQTRGRRMRPGDDWRYDIQHVDAQARFVRDKIDDRAIVLVYLENDLKSWPAWRRKHGDARIREIIEAVTERYGGQRPRVVLDGHSGGGSLIFGYINSVESIPDEVERIAFLDSNYAYETARHRDKLVNWLRASDRHYLVVVAYDDANALLNGKPFVSPDGGTWGRSRIMKQDLGAAYAIVGQPLGHLGRHTSLDRRITFLLSENPERKILHTLQVELNGFIESLLAGTELEGVGYRYLGARAYDGFIRPE